MSAFVKPARPSLRRMAPPIAGSLALYDWTSEKQANTHTAAANRKKLAGEAARLIETDQKANADCPTPLPHPRLSRGISDG